MPTKSPRKQRKALYNLPLHKRRKQMAAHLADDLLEKYKRRSLPVRVGDTVRVVRGDYSGETGKVLSIDHDAYTIQVDGVTVRQARGTEMPRPIRPSNVLITKLNLQDPIRRDRLAAKGVEVEVPEPEPEPEPEPPAVEEAPEPTGGEEE